MVIQEPSPQTSSIKSSLKRVDYTDTFSTTNHVDPLPVITNKIFATAPGWVKALMQLRNTLVKVVGLKTDFSPEKDQVFKVGGKVAFFKIYEIHDNEILLGEDDSHLNFRVSIFDSKEAVNNIKVTTLVAYKNGFGKFYFAIVRPFHKLIVRSMVGNGFAKGEEVTR